MTLTDIVPWEGVFQIRPLHLVVRRQSPSVRVPNWTEFSVGLDRLMLLFDRSGRGEQRTEFHVCF